MLLGLLVGANACNCDRPVFTEGPDGSVLINVENWNKITASDSRWGRFRASGTTGIMYEEGVNTRSIVNEKTADNRRLCYTVQFSDGLERKMEMYTWASGKTEHNDVWVTMKDYKFTLKKISNGKTTQWGADKLCKMYQNEKQKWTWRTRTVDFNPHEFYFTPTEGSGYRTEFCMSGRSTKFAVAKVLFFKTGAAGGPQYKSEDKDLSAKLNIKETCTCNGDPSPPPSTPKPTPSTTSKPTQKPTPKPTPKPTASKSPGSTSDSPLPNQCLGSTPRASDAYCRIVPRTDPVRVVEAFDLTNQNYQNFCARKGRAEPFTAASRKEYNTAIEAAKLLCNGKRSECMVRFRFQAQKSFYEYAGEPITDTTGCAAIIGYSSNSNKIGKIAQVGCTDEIPFLCYA